MKRRKKIIVIIVSIVILVAAAIFLVVRIRTQLPDHVWESVAACAENQQSLYRSLEFYVEENGRLPDDIHQFTIAGFPAEDHWRCPACGRGYDVFLENWGNPHAVLIADRENKHPTTLTLSLKGVHPQVQTMGDGTIHIFKDGKIATMPGSKNKHKNNR